MCIPWARYKELKYLDNFLNGPDFSLNKVSSISVREIASKIQKMGMQKQNCILYPAGFLKNKHVWNGKKQNYT